jgi:predicted P-loop ATPase/GTPase
MFGKPAPRKCGNGWKGWYKGNFFRSLLELGYMINCDSKDIQFKSGESTEFKVEYEIDGTRRTYHPDFYIPSNGKVIEIKPKIMINFKSNAVKISAAKLKFGDRFEVLTEDIIKRPESKDLCILIENGTVILDRKTKIKLNQLI